MAPLKILIIGANGQIGLAGGEGRQRARQGFVPQAQARGRADGPQRAMQSGWGSAQRRA